MGEGSAESEISTIKWANIEIIYNAFTINNISHMTKVLLEANVIPMIWLEDMSRICVFS